MSTQKKLSIEVIGGLILFVSALLAIIVNNSPLSTYYSQISIVKAGFTIGSFVIHKSLLHWINDGLMAMYFLLIGLEIKREFVGGSLSNPASVSVPAVAAVFGLLVPAGIYVAFNIHSPMQLNGWAIPAATDIAFTLGVLALLGSRVPTSLKILVTTIAIFDDIAAIAIIAVFYTKSLSFVALLFAAVCLAILIIINRMGVKKLAPYLIIGAIMWFCVLKSGVHATLAGVALAMCIPHTEKNSPLLKLEHGLSPWIIFMILPIFAFANAGVSFASMTFGHVIHPVSLGIILGLFLGKQVGIFGALYAFSKTRFFTVGKNLSTGQLYGGAAVCGIGFTMSLFIGGLAFNIPELNNMVKVGVISGSLLSGIVGYIALLLFSKTPSKA